VARGLQRIGRAGHTLDAVSRGRIFPKFRGDLLECAVVARGMEEGAIEETRIPRNPLDVLAQQIVAICADEEIAVDDLGAAAEDAGMSVPDFVRQSIVDPDAVIAPDYQPGVMPKDFAESLSPEELDALVAYVSGEES